jgi:hypothetical protein
MKEDIDPAMFSLFDVLKVAVLGTVFVLTLATIIIWPFNAHTLQNGSPQH